MYKTRGCSFNQAELTMYRECGDYLSPEEFWDTNKDRINSVFFYEQTRKFEWAKKHTPSAIDVHNNMALEQAEKLTKEFREKWFTPLLDVVYEKYDQGDSNFCENLHANYANIQNAINAIAVENRLEADAARISKLENFRGGSLPALWYLGFIHVVFLIYVIMRH